MDADSKWMPAETAPKDGTHVLAYDAKLSWPIQVCVWDAHHAKLTNGWTKDWTHWMPLPPKPLGMEAKP